MKHLIGIVAVVAVAMAVPAGFEHWTSTQLRGAGKRLSAKINAQKVASEPLGSFGNHSMAVAHREGDGEAELHETQHDIFIAQSGAATLMVGGKLVEQKTTAPHEFRAKAISGGEKRKLAPGDIVHIPAGVPHQLLVAGGTEFTYAVVKIDVK